MSESNDRTSNRIKAVDAEIQKKRNELAKMFSSQPEWQEHNRKFNKYVEIQEKSDKICEENNILFKTIQDGEREFQELEVIYTINSNRDGLLKKDYKYLKKKSEEIFKLNEEIIEKLENSKRLKEEIERNLLHKNKRLVRHSSSDRIDRSGDSEELTENRLLKEIEIGEKSKKEKIQIMRNEEDLKVEKSRKKSINLAIPSPITSSLSPSSITSSEETDLERKVNLNHLEVEKSMAPMSLRKKIVESEEETPPTTL